MNKAKYVKGDKIKISSLFPPGHVRTPFFIRGKNGIIDYFWGTYPNPEELAYGREGVPGHPLYKVKFKQFDLWENYEGSPRDSLSIDIYENWLEPIK